MKFGPELNSISVAGKVSKVAELRYTPAGIALCEFTIAVRQRYFDRVSIGYFDVVTWGVNAEEVLPHIKIGRALRINGSLWTRSFRNRQGIKVSETKILAESIEGVTYEKKR